MRKMKLHLASHLKRKKAVKMGGRLHLAGLKRRSKTLSGGASGARRIEHPDELGGRLKHSLSLKSHHKSIKPLKFRF